LRPGPIEVLLPRRFDPTVAIEWTRRTPLSTRTTKRRFACTRRHGDGALGVTHGANWADAGRSTCSSDVLARADCAVLSTAARFASYF